MLLEIRWTASALFDLQEIYEYVARDSPSAADRLVDKLAARPDQLPTQPNSGRVVPEFRVESIRELVEEAYRIVYQVADSQIFILRVSHHARRLKL